VRFFFYLLTKEKICLLLGHLIGNLVFNYKNKKKLLIQAMPHNNQNSPFIMSLEVSLYSIPFEVARAINGGTIYCR